MKTIASLADRLDMTADEAVEKLQYMFFDVDGPESVISDEECDLLIDVDDDPSIAERVRADKLKEREKAKKAAAKAAAKRKTSAKKKTTAKKKAAAAPPAEIIAETEGGEAKAPAAEILPPADAPTAEILEPDASPDTPKPKAEILTAEEESALEKAHEEEVPAEPEVAPAPVEAKKPAPELKKAKKKTAKPKDEGPAIVIGSAIEHDTHRAEVVRADGTHLDATELVEALPEGEVAAAEEEEEEVGLLAEAERRQEEEERRKVKTTARPAPKPDPAVVAEVIRKAKQKESERQQRPKPAGQGGSGPAHVGSRKTGKTARKRQKRLERLRAEETMRRDAMAAVREYQAGGFDGTKKKRRKRSREEMDGVDSEFEQKIEIEVVESITVEELANAMDFDTTDIILELMEINIMATKNQALGVDLVRQIAEPHGFEVKSVIPEEELLLSDEMDDPASLKPRAPVVTVMGHVDHGKTSLLDQVRKASVAEGEAGGITQHIAAYEVETETGRVVFLDTPGHEAFTAMRARGAKVTDVVVLVVAADDGIMPQTIEAIDHAKAAEVPIVVAINKCDKPDAQPDRIRQELVKYDLTDEAWGGKTIIKNISAKSGEGIQELMEMLTLETELLELKANPDKRARGAIIESEFARGQGPVAWVLVQSGTLRVGDAFVAGTTHGRVRAMLNSRGEAIESAGPSSAVVVMGFSAPADAGDTFVTMEDERAARALAEKRATVAKHRLGPAMRHVTLEDLHAQLLAGEKQELNVVIKADVQGSVDVLESSLPKLGNEEVQVKIVHSGVGSINESDVLLASASDAVILGFHVTAAPKVDRMAKDEGVEIREYKIIYEAIEDVRKALEGLLKPEEQEVITGHAEIRSIFRSSALGNIAGCYQLDGEMKRDTRARVLRGKDKEVVYSGRIGSLRQGKDQVSNIRTGFECGIVLDGFNDIQEGDIIEAYEIQQVAKTLS